MAKASPFLQTFDGGELSPLLGARTDLAKYFNGCATLENFLPTVQGPLVRRGGFQFIHPIKTGRAWLIRFQVSERIAYMLEFGPYYIRFYTNRGLLAPGGVPVEVATPYGPGDLTGEAGSCGIRVVQSADTMYIFHGKHQPRKLLRTGPEAFELQAVELSGGPFDDVNTDKNITVSVTAETGAVTINATGNIFDPLHVGSLFYIESADLAAVRPWAVYQEVSVGDRRRVDSRVYQCTATGGDGAVTGVNTPIHAEGKAWDGDGIDIPDDQRGPIGVEWEFLHAGYGIIEITEYLAGNEVRGTVAERLPSELVPGGGSSTVTTEYPVTAISESLVPGRLTVGAAGHPFSANDSITLSGTNFIDPDLLLPDASRDGAYVISSVATNVYEISGTFPSGRVYDPSATGKATRTITTNYTEHTPTYKWAHSLFSDVNGWPELGAFWRQRLTLIAGRKVAMSVIGDFESFDEKIGGEIAADSAIVQTLNARQINRVVWAVESDELMLGTDGDEWLIGPIQASQAVGPANIRAERRTSYGSRPIQPAEVGGKVLFIQSSGRRLRDYVYDYDTNNYASSDATKLATHVLESGAIDMTYQQEPDSVVWVARADGTLVGCTYDQEPGRSDVYAWHPHPLTNGRVESVEAMPAPDGGSDDLWVIVRRQINGQTVRYVELLRNPLRFEEAQQEAFYVDSGLTYRGAPTSAISGLDHLEGETVQILADGAAHPDRVVENGSVELQWEASVVHAGLPAPCAMCTMSIEAGSANGTAQAKQKKITNVGVRMHRSLGGNLGPTRDNLELLNFRRPSQPMGAPPPLFSGDMITAWRGGFERDARIWYTNDQPLPVTLLGLMPIVSTNDDR